MNLNIHIGSHIIIVNSDDAPIKFITRLTKILTRANPEVKQLKGIGVYSAHLPKTIKMYNYVYYGGNKYTSLRTHRGNWAIVKQEIESYNKIADVRGHEKLTYSVKMKLIQVPTKFPKFKFTLEDYQQKALDIALTKNQGIISFPPGGGKTVTAIALMKARNVRTLVVVHTHDLVSQWKSSLEKAFGKINVGIIAEGEVQKESKRITVALVQTLVSMDNADKIISGYGMIQMDECHHVPAPTFEDVISRSAAEFRYGFTASLKRRDRKEFLMHAVFGETLIELTYEDIAHRVILPEIRAVDIEDIPDCPVEDLYVERRGSIHMQHTVLYNWMAESEVRNNILKRIIDECLEDPNNVTLFLTKRREHAKMMHEYVEGKGIPSALLLGGGTKKYKREKEVKLQEAREGKVKFIAGTSIADEGLDVVTLTRLILSMPGSFDEILRQRIGRVSRKIEGKKTPITYDVKDNYLPEMVNAWFARYRFYKKLNLDVHTLDHQLNTKENLLDDST